MTLEERKQHARAFVNARRKELGLRATGRLTKGWPGASSVCCLAKSLRSVGVCTAGAAADEVVLSGYDSKGICRVRFWRDPEVAQFIRDFDEGLYPELVIKSKPIKVAGKVVIE